MRNAPPRRPRTGPPDTGGDSDSSRRAGAIGRESRGGDQGPGVQSQLHLYLAGLVPVWGLGSVEGSGAQGPADEDLGRATEMVVRHRDGEEPPAIPLRVCALDS